MNLNKSKLNRLFLLGLFLVILVYCFINSSLFFQFSPLHQDGVGEFKVTKFIDGDTIEVDIRNKPILIRFLGINTPEKNNYYRSEQCFGPEASEETKRLLSRRKVYLLPDPNAPNKDKYGRLLRYVFLPDGTFVNALLVKQGYAFAYIYDNENLEFARYFEELESEAKNKKLGLWGKCNY